MPIYLGDWGKGLDMLDSGFYNMDCMDGMKQFPDKYFEMAIVDPPYGIGNWVPQGGKGAREDCKDHRITWNDKTPDPCYFDELIRVSQKQIIWGANYYNCFADKGGAVVWDKGDGNPRFSQCEIASLSFQKRVDYVRDNWQSGFFRTSIDKIIHECQKPISLYRWLLSKYANAGDKILDTHVGSASSLVACHQMGFQYWGFELDEHYYKAACERIERARAQVSMSDILSEPSYEQVKC
jgi:site-specific DNA-methyltransferase (adenine-specific)